METPLVSVIVPIYNVQSYLRRCLDSIVEQTYQNLEIIAVDDGATDLSGKIVEEYATSDQRIIPIHKKNGGLSSARNEGLQIYRGEYLLYVDGDDYLDRYCIEALVAEACKYSADVVLFPYIREYSDKSRMTKLFAQEFRIFRGQEIEDEILSLLIGPGEQKKYNPLTMNRLNTAWGKLYKREAIEGIKFTDTKEIGMEDGFYNIQVFLKLIRKATEFARESDQTSGARDSVNTEAVAVYTEKTWYHYEKGNGTSLLHSYRDEYFKKRWNFYARVRELLCKSGREKFERNLNNRIILELYGMVSNIVSKKASFKEKEDELKQGLNSYSYERYFAGFDFGKLLLPWRIFYKMVEKRKTAGLIHMLSLVVLMKP